MATKQTRQKNSKSSMSLGSALLLILLVVLVRWYGGGSSAETTATQSADSNEAVQATLQPVADKSAEIVVETATAEERDSEATAEDDASPEVELVVATLPPVEPDRPTPTVAATATDAPEDAVTEASPTRAPPTDTPLPSATPKPTASPTATPTQVRSISGLPLVFYDELPPEAHDTITLIDSNGPFPFYKDGATFQNRERILPRRSSGYYHEYTVITPWEDDRGARRIVAGAEGELYYTDDHYDSFREVVR